MLERQRPEQRDRRNDERGHEDLRTMAILGRLHRFGATHPPRCRNADQRQHQHAVGDITQPVAEQERCGDQRIKGGIGEAPVTRR